MQRCDIRCWLSEDSNCYAEGMRLKIVFVMQQEQSTTWNMVFFCSCGVLLLMHEPSIEPVGLSNFYKISTVCQCKCQSSCDMASECTLLRKYRMRRGTIVVLPR